MSRGEVTGVWIDEADSIPSAAFVRVREDRAAITRHVFAMGEDVSCDPASGRLDLSGLIVFPGSVVHPAGSLSLPPIPPALLNASAISFALPNGIEPLPPE